MSKAIWLLSLNDASRSGVFKATGFMACLKSNENDFRGYLLDQNVSQNYLTF